jgi:hypothetical protein
MAVLPEDNSPAQADDMAVICFSYHDIFWPQKVAYHDNHILYSIQYT